MPVGRVAKSLPGIHAQLPGELKLIIINRSALRYAHADKNRLRKNQVRFQTAIANVASSEHDTKPC